MKRFGTGVRIPPPPLYCFINEANVRQIVRQNPYLLLQSDYIIAIMTSKDFVVYVEILMMAKQSNRVGRPRKENSRVYGLDGSEIPYMRKDGVRNHYVRWKDDDGKWHKKNLGRTTSKALIRYAKWEAEQRGEEFSILNKPNYLKSLSGKAEILLSEDVYEMLEEKDIDPSSFLRDIIDKMTIESVNAPDSYVWERAKELIHSNPRNASRILEIPYENLIGLNKKKNYTLEEIGDNYFNKVEFQGELKTSQKSELDKVRNTWDRFGKIVKVKTILEIDKTHINKYYNNIYKKYQSGWSTTWIKGYFERIKRVLNSATIDLDHPDDIIEVLRLCRNKLKSPRQIVQNPPYRIKKSEFKKLLDGSNTEMKAMWLLSMNCAYYAVDVATVPLSAFDWDEKTVVFRRGKTEARGKGHRAAVLWDITIDALKKYIEDNKKRKRETLFVSCYGSPYVEGRIRKKFVKIRNEAGLEHIEHQNFRDSVESIGQKIRGIQNSVDAVMGQNPQGNRGDYVDPEIVPEIAESACKAVYDYYFG